MDGLYVPSAESVSVCVTGALLYKQPQIGDLIHLSYKCSNVNVVLDVVQGHFHYKLEKTISQGV